ncbi:hypothetical protein C8034_v009599 [Colletotrichum sidae]|uniref:Secreted protein n=1 Tax=Colletotrichum sidae TaxID=1347389 RepID=A0A4R8TM13_9PEZI|nr:hypothetical protein C8034_v009599 [Colletotrichum sidae]
MLVATALAVAAFSAVAHAASDGRAYFCINDRTNQIARSNNFCNAVKGQTFSADPGFCCISKADRAKIDALGKGCTDNGLKLSWVTGPYPSCTLQ